MSENQPSEQDRQQRLAELQARLQRLTEERKADLRRSGPLPGDVSPPSAEDEGPEQAADMPAVAAPAPEPQASAPPPPDPLPVLEKPPGREAAVDQPVTAASPSPELEQPAWLKGMRAADVAAAEATADEPEPIKPAAVEPPPPAPSATEPEAAVEPPPPAPSATEPTAAAEPEAPAEPLLSEPAAAATPAQATRDASIGPPATPAAGTSALAARIVVMLGDAKRAARGLGRRVNAKGRALASQRPRRRPRPQQPKTDAPAASEESVEHPAKKRTWLRAAVLAGAVFGGGIAFMQFSDVELPRVLKGMLPAAEADDAGSPSLDAAGSALPVEKAAGRVAGKPATGQALVGGSSLDEASSPVEAAPAATRPAPPELEITSPTAPAVEALDVDLAPLEPAASLPTPIASSSSPPATGNPTERPTFIPYDVPPRLENAGEIQRLLERGYPSQLREAGIQGTVILWIFVDEQGAVKKTEVKESSGYEAMDEAALDTAEKMRFTPAMNRDKATPVWLAQPITFR
jgi:protein TonB